MFVTHIFKIFPFLALLYTIYPDDDFSLAADVRIATKIVKHYILKDVKLLLLGFLCKLFPKSYLQVSGCYYHLCSNIWKHVQDFGLQIRYMADEEFALTIRMLAALAFVPPNDVIDLFNAVEVWHRSFQLHVTICHP